MDEAKIKEAQKDFDKIIKNSSKKDIERVKKGAYGLSAVRFASQYVSSQKDNDTYKKIYNIFYNYFNKLK